MALTLPATAACIAASAAAATLLDILQEESELRRVVGDLLELARPHELTVDTVARVGWRRAPRRRREAAAENECRRTSDGRDPR